MSILDFMAEPAPVEEVKIGRYAGGQIHVIDGWDGPAFKACLVRASGRASAGQVEIVIEHHAVIRYTPCGAWIDTWEGDKFVNLRAEKQWASATEAEAIDQLYYRKHKQVRILEARLEEAREVQAAMEKHFDKKPRPARRYHYSEYDYY